MELVERVIRAERADDMFRHIDACPSPCKLEGVTELQSDAKRVPIREALRCAVIAKHTPKYGKPLGRDVLKGARSCKFDHDGYVGKPRFRLVYDVLPGHVVRVLAMGPRETIYETATNRAANEAAEWLQAA